MQSWEVYLNLTGKKSGLEFCKKRDPLNLNGFIPLRKSSFELGGGDRYVQNGHIFFSQTKLDALSFSGHSDAPPVHTPLITQTLTLTPRIIFRPTNWVDFPHFSLAAPVNFRRKLQTFLKKL